MTARDDELFVVLAAALGPVPAAEPTRAELARFQRAVAHSGNRVLAWRVPRPLTAALAGFLVLGGASAAAAATGAVMPEPVRVAVRAVGLPIDSPQTADVRTAIARLRDALDARPRSVSEIRERAQQLRADLARLPAGDRVGFDAQANFLLVEADNAVAVPPPPPPTSTPPVRSASPPPTAPARPAARVDDSSGDEHTQPSTEPSQSGDGGEHTATTVQTQTSGHDGGSSDGGGSDGGGGPGPSSDGGGSGHDGGGSSSDGGGHSGPD